MEKRNSGRTGRRRYSVGEARLAGPKALADHKRRYGVRPERADDGPGPPAAWLDDDAKAAWYHVMSKAPPGLLQRIDAIILAPLAGAIAQHQRWTVLLQQAWLNDPTDARTLALLDRQVHRSASQVSRLATVLGLSPAARARLVEAEVPAPVEKNDRWGVLKIFPG